MMMMTDVLSVCLSVTLVRYIVDKRSPISATAVLLSSYLSTRESAYVGQFLLLLLLPHVAQNRGGSCLLCLSCSYGLTACACSPGHLQKCLINISS